MMPMPNEKPMNEEKDSKVKCPACGEMLSLEPASEASAEHDAKPPKLMKAGPPKPKSNAANMPMDKLKEVIKGPSDGAY